MSAVLNRVVWKGAVYEVAAPTMTAAIRELKLGHVGTGRPLARRCVCERNHRTATKVGIDGISAVVCTGCGWIR